MLSVAGKGYKIFSRNPFHEDPLPRAFYHPSKKRQLSKSEKKLALSPVRSEGALQAPADELEQNFLSQSHTIRPFTSSPKQTPANPPSDKFDESWPDSERPSSPREYGSSNEEKRETIFSTHDRAPEKDYTLQTGASQVKVPHGMTTSLPPAGQNSAPDEVSKKAWVEPADKEQSGPQFVPAGKLTALQKYIERFRYGKPTSREERMKSEEMKQEFWWRESSTSSHCSTWTPADREVRPMPYVSQQHAGLTREKLQEHDQHDEMTEQLQQKAEHLLKSAQSLASSDPVVSTEGLGSTGSDISSFSEPAVRPSFLPRQATDEMHQRLNEVKAMGLSVGSKKTEDDILYKWRLQHKIEQAKQHPLLPPDETAVPKKTPADEEIANRLSEFRKKLLQQTTLASRVVRDAQVERIVRETQTMMDSAVQTSPQSGRSYSIAEVPRVPIWSKKADSSVQTDSHPSLNPAKDIQATSLPSDEGQPLGGNQQHHIASENSVQEIEEDGREDKCSQSAVIPGKQEGVPRAEHQSEIYYRQFLKAEKPHVHDGGDTPEKKADQGKNWKKTVGTRGMNGKDSRKTSPDSSAHLAQLKHNREQVSVLSPGGDYVVREKEPQHCDENVPPETVQSISSEWRNSIDSFSRGESEEIGSNIPSQKRNRSKRYENDRELLKWQQTQDHPITQHVRETQGLQNTRFTQRDSGPKEGLSRDQSCSDTGDKRVHGQPSEPQAQVQRKSTRERTHRSAAMPPPHFSSSPARTPLSAAIGQVVHDRLFDVSESFVSSVDSSCSPVFTSSRNIQMPQDQLPSSRVSTEDYESDGEFESDSLLQLLRQQRSQYEEQLRYLDSVLAETT